MRVLAIVAVAGCHGGTEPVDEVPLGRCAWNGAELATEPLGGATFAVGDVSGDGQGDWVTLTPAGPRVVAGPWPGTQLATILDAQRETFVRIVAGDLDGDGTRDLVFTRPWRGEVSVWFGPVAAGAVLDADAPALAITSMQDGLSDLFGVGVAIVDVTGDGQADLVIGAPAEGEEACAGTRDGGIWPSPLAPGHTTREAAPRPLRAEPTTCLGNVITAAEADGAPGTELVIAGNSVAHAYALPLADPAVAVFSATGYYPLGAGDLDGDGRADIVFEHGAVAFADGHASDPMLPFDVAAHVFAPQPWAGHDLALIATGSTLFAHDGTATSLAAMPVLARGEFAGQASVGDLDGDGRADLVVGDQLVRCAR